MNRRNWRYIKLLLIHSCVFLSFTVFAQCPPNIGFEAGSFDQWECGAGNISMTTGIISLNSTGPMNGRHTMIQNTYPQAKDLYGNFPVNCPNGSGFSIQLGNALTGAQAERVSYTFNIPADQNNYSLIYNYAVVFENPTHDEWQQPKFTANVYDVTNDAYIGCSSFSYAASSNLPGFKLATRGARSEVYYKTWTPVTIKLSGYAGRTIRLEFTTNDCTRGGHFGYAYVDVNEDCSSPISGNTQCVNDTSQVLTAPFGFAGYRWFNGDFSKILGTGSTLSFRPAPAPGGKYAVEVTPFLGQGCIDTVYTVIQYSSDTIDLKVPTAPIIACVTEGVDLTDPEITIGSSAGLIFSYFTDPSQIEYVATPKFLTASGTYYIKAVNSAGCTAMRSLTVKVALFPTFTLAKSVQPVVRPTSFDLNSLIGGDTKGIIFSFWKDSLLTIPLTNPGSVSKSGTYYIKGINDGGCFIVKSITVVIIDPPVIPPNAFSPNGDGVNDTWEIPVLSLFPDCVVEIFNRLGQLIFKSTGYLKPWDGKYNGIDLPIATYYYVIKATDELPPVGGGVTIVR